MLDRIIELISAVGWVCLFVVVMFIVSLGICSIVPLLMVLLDIKA